MPFWWTDEDFELMQGACDLHVHLGPCIYERQTNELDFPRLAHAVGYRAVLSKCHHTLNADRLELVKRVIPDFEIHGGIVLNHFVGGLNPYAVEASFASGGRAVWGPTMHAANHVRTFGTATYARLRPKAVHTAADLPAARSPISAFDDDGRLRPELYDIVDLVAANNGILASGHFGFDETLALFTVARERGVQKLIVTHAEMEVSNLNVEQQRVLADLGAHIEHVLLPCLPIYRRLDPAEITHAIKEIGPERTILSTDLGQGYNPHPIEGMRQFVRTLLYAGLQQADVDRMLKRNPAELLGV
jgi:hypothetical protein